MDQCRARKFWEQNGQVVTVKGRTTGRDYPVEHRCRKATGHKPPHECNCSNRPRGAGKTDLMVWS